MVRKGKDKRQMNLYSSQETKKITSSGEKLETETVKKGGGGKRRKEDGGESLSWKKIRRR